MLLVDRSEILVEPRQRSSISAEPLSELKRSILERGLINPVCVSIALGAPDGIHYRLQAGERRLRALDELCREGAQIYCHSEMVPFGKIPVTTIISTSPVESFSIELEENIIREDLSWQDRAAAVAKLHELRKSENPGHTLAETSEELISKGAPAGSGVGQSQIHLSTIVAKYLDRDSVSGARSLKEAYQIAVKEESLAYEHEFLSRRKASAEAIPRESLVTPVHGDLRTILPTLPEDSFDLVLCDPPYGIGAHTSSYRSRLTHAHNYLDTQTEARSLLDTIVREGFRVLKPQANLFLFTDVRNFFWLVDLATQIGYRPWPTPIIWQKSLSEGFSPWGRHGFAHTYETIFWAVKGIRGLRNTTVDILTYPRVRRSERIFAAEKPIELLQKLIEISTLPGDVILDPCMGSGSTLVASRSLERRALGIEIDESVYQLAYVRLERGDSEANWSAMDTEELIQEMEANDALEERQIPGDDLQEHQGDEIFGLPTGPGRGGEPRDSSSITRQGPFEPEAR